MKNAKVLAIALAMVTVAGINFAVFTAPVAAQSATPCTDGFEACMEGGGSYNACNAGWCACMDAEYGVEPAEFCGDMV